MFLTVLNMKEGLYKTQINEISDILKKLELYEDRNYNPIYPSNPAAIFKGLNYANIWEKCFKEQYYDFQLIDDSLLQFRVESYNPLYFSYAYYECPYIPQLPFQDFLRDFYEIADWDSPHYRKRDFDDFYLFVEKKRTCNANKIRF